MSGPRHHYNGSRFHCTRVAFPLQRYRSKNAESRRDHSAVGCLADSLYIHMPASEDIPLSKVPLLNGYTMINRAVQLSVYSSVYV